MQKKDEFAKALNHYLARAERPSTWLAGKLKVSPSTVSRWANGETQPSSMTIIDQVIELLEVDNEQERIAFYQAAGFQAPPRAQTQPNPEETGMAATPRLEPVSPRSPIANGQPYREVRFPTVAQAKAAPPTPSNRWLQRRTLAVILVALAAFVAGPAACDTAQHLLLPSPVKTEAPQIFNFNGPVEQFINEVENLTIVTGDSPAEKQRKTAQRAALIAGEVRYYLASVDRRLGLINTVLAEDTFGQQLAQTRATVAPALQEMAASGYQKLIAEEQIKSLRQQLNTYPLPSQPDTALFQLADEGVVDSTPLRFFYDQLGEVTWATESLLETLRERAEEGDQRWQKNYTKMVNVAVALVENRSAFAQVAGLQLLGALATIEPKIAAAPMHFTHLAAHPLLATGITNTYMTELANDVERLQQERQALLAEGERLLVEALKTYQAVNQELVIQPDDSWALVVAKAISLRQLGRIADAIAAFAQYGDRFGATDPTAKRYAHLARHFTLQMAALGVVDGGVYLFAVEPDSMAAQAGLRAEDIVVAMNERPVRNVLELQEILATIPIGELLTVTVVRLDENALLVRTTVSVMYKKPLGIGYMPI